MSRIRLLAHSGLTMISVMATCIMRGVQPLQYRGHPMWDFNEEDDATRHGRKGPGSVAELVKILSALYKGEEEDFLRVSPLNGFSMNNPRSWVSEHPLFRTSDPYSHGYIFHFVSSTQELRQAVKDINSPPPQPEDLERFLDPASQEDPDILVELIDGVFHQLSIDNALVAITADYPGILPASEVTETEAPVL